MPFINFALCYCTAEQMSSRGRPSSIVCPSVNPNPSSRLMRNLVASLQFNFWQFFRLHKQVPIYEKKFKRHLLWKDITDSLSQKIMHISGKGLYQGYIKFGEVSNCGFLPLFFFSFSLICDHMGEETPKDILSDSTRAPKKIQAYSYEGSLPKLHKELWTFKLWFLDFFSAV